MKKVLIVICMALIVYITPNVSFASSKDLDNEAKKFGISEFLNESKKYSSEFNLNDLFKESLNGKFDNNKVLGLITKLLGPNIKNAILTLSGVMIVVIINSVLKAISENLGNESVSKIAYYIEYILIVTIIMHNFSNVITSVKQALQELSAFSNSLIPLLSTLVIATGNVTTSGMIEPILLIAVTFISNFVINVLIPIILVAFALEVVSKISNQVQVKKLSVFMKKGSLWTLTTVLTLFMTIASLEGGLTSSIDGVTLKAGKSIVSAVIPVVGKILGDAVDTVMGYSNIIKNAVGFIGIIVIISICVKPIINLTVLTITYKLGAALSEPIADKQVVEIIDSMAGIFKILLGIMFASTVFIVIGIAIVLKISNSGIMYG